MEEDTSETSDGVWKRPIKKSDVIAFMQTYLPWMKPEDILVDQNNPIKD